MRSFTRLLVAGAATLLGFALDPVEARASAAAPQHGEIIPLTAPPDAELEARLTGIFRQMGDLEGVRVDVRHGVVRLSGTTDSPSLEERATTTAARVEGVVYVRNDIAQPPSRWGPLAPTTRTLRRLGRSVVDFLPEVAVALVAFLPFALVAAIVRRWHKPFHALGLSPLTGSLLRVALRVLLLLTGILVVLDVLGVMRAVGAVVGTIGVLGIVAGFVFKDWVAIYLPGLMLGLNPPFKAGDLVEVGGREGRVARITPSATVLVTTDGEEVRVPNIEIFQETFINLSLHRTRRLRFRVALAHEADLGLTNELARRAMLGLRGIKSEPPPFMRVQVLGREEVEVEFFAWVDQDAANFRNVESRAKRAVFEVLREHHVPLAALGIVVRRPAHGEETEAARARTPAGIPEQESRAESSDEGFLDRTFEEARARRTERDLLQDGQPAPSQASGR